MPAPLLLACCHISLTASGSTFHHAHRNVPAIIPQDRFWHISRNLHLAHGIDWLLIQFNLMCYTGVSLAIPLLTALLMLSGISVGHSCRD